MRRFFFFFSFGLQVRKRKAKLAMSETRNCVMQMLATANKLQGKLKQENIYGESLVPLNKDKCVRYC